MEQRHTLKPYLMQAVYNWCIDTEMTPYLEVMHSKQNTIPASVFPNNHSVVIFNISRLGAKGFTFEEEGVKFKTMIGKSLEDIFINYHSIKKIFSKELGHGLEFSSFTMGNMTGAEESSDEASEGATKKSKSKTKAKKPTIEAEKGEKGLFLVVNNVQST